MLKIEKICITFDKGINRYWFNPFGYAGYLKNYYSFWSGAIDNKMNKFFKRMSHYD